LETAQGVADDSGCTDTHRPFPMIEVNWLLFVAASLVLIVVPGQDMVLVMSRSIAQGVAAGVTTATGVCSGLVVHTVLATLGLSALIRASEWLYFGLQLGGAAYLAWIGLQLLRAPQQQLAIAGSAVKRPARLFIDGALSNICNPKIAVFYVAFLPQFVAPGAAHATLSLFALGLAFALLALLVKGPLAIGAAGLSTWLRAHPQSLVWLFRSSGAVLLGLALQLALQGTE
jgi:threonine/homoserine/homoserine lactone efflux protein